MVGLRQPHSSTHLELAMGAGSHMAYTGRLAQDARLLSGMVNALISARDAGDTKTNLAPLANFVSSGRWPRGDRQLRWRIYVHVAWHAGISRLALPPPPPLPFRWRSGTPGKDSRAALGEGTSGFPRAARGTYPRT